MRIVLLGAGGTSTSFAIASRIRANWGSSVKLIVIDVFDARLVTTSLLADAFYKVPFAKDPEFSEALADIILNERVQTFIPILNEEIILASKFMKDPQFKDVDFWSSDLHAMCTDKLFSDSWLQGIGVRTPAKLNFNNPGSDNGPWFSKPRNGFGSKGANILALDQLRNLEEKIKDSLLVQEICNPPEVTVDSFFDDQSSIGYAYCRERIETKAGVCTKARLYADQELTDFARIIGKSLKQRGIICFQVMKSKQGWAVTDLNLRSGAGTALTCTAGFDVISAAFACRLGEDFCKYLRPLRDGEQFYITRQYSEFVMEHIL